MRFFCFIIVLLSCGCSNNSLSPDLNFVFTTEVFESNVVGDSYQLDLYLPGDYNPSEPYPVIFLLDGNWYFEDFTNELVELVEDKAIPSSILVSIGYLDGHEEKRFRDYTFPADPEYDWATGKADLFSQFLEQELIPKIKNEYATDKTQYVLMGHSLGGFNTLYNLFQATSSFNGFVAVSASIWWRNAYLFSLEEMQLEKEPGINTKVHISFGGDEPPSMTILNEEMVERLQTQMSSDFRIDSKTFKGASHSQVAMPGFVEGIQFVLN